MLKRDDIWLLSRLDYIWTEYFADVKQSNKIFIRFGRYARFRLGSIKLDQKKGYTFITITSIFTNPQVPIEVIDHTIAHELCHYTHGFSSPHPKLHKYPHHGGVIKQEMAERNLSHLTLAYHKWIKLYRKQLENAK
ncbi:MAG: hypothetical protein Q8P92_00870 [Candidatus Daviesbacteria bacterium]|nr:hypothetical protein [Candidatus Daviesbacteria bacterium]